MNNIEILEEFIKNYKEVQEKYKDDEIQAEIERIIKPIYNFKARN
jgi:hypothetical protein